MELTLFGLPMYRVVPSRQALPAAIPALASASSASVGQNASGAAESSAADALAAPSCGALNCDTITSEWNAFTTAGSADGRYETLDGYAHIQEGRPVLPKHFVGFPHQVRGVVFLGGRYLDVNGYDPVIAHAVNDVTHREREPAYRATAWYPQLPFQVTALRQPTDALDQLLITLAAQYRGTEGSGTLRLYTQATYQWFWSTAPDETPPSVTDPKVSYTVPGVAEVAVTARDNSGLFKVLLTWTANNGQWTSVEMLPDPSGGDRYAAALAPDPANATDYFVQAIDLAGNVTRALPPAGYHQLPPTSSPGV